MDLIKKSVATRLRPSCNSAGSPSAPPARPARRSILGDAEKVARGFLEDDKTKLAWNLPRVLMAEEPGQAAAQHAADRRPDDPARRQADGRSGRRGRRHGLSHHARPAPMPRFRRRCRNCSRAARMAERVDAHAMQPFYTGLLAARLRADRQDRREGDAVVDRALTARCAAVAMRLTTAINSGVVCARTPATKIKRLPTHYHHRARAAAGRTPVREGPFSWTICCVSS